MEATAYNTPVKAPIGPFATNDGDPYNIDWHSYLVQWRNTTVCGRSNKARPRLPQSTKSPGKDNHGFQGFLAFDNNVDTDGRGKGKLVGNSEAMTFGDANVVGGEDGDSIVCGSAGVFGEEFEKPALEMEHPKGDSETCVSVDEEEQDVKLFLEDTKYDKKGSGEDEKADEDETLRSINDEQTTGEVGEQNGGVDELTEDDSDPLYMIIQRGPSGDVSSLEENEMDTTFAADDTATANHLDENSESQKKNEIEVVANGDVDVDGVPQEVTPDTQAVKVEETKKEKITEEAPNAEGKKGFFPFRLPLDHRNGHVITAVKVLES